MTTLAIQKVGRDKVRIKGIDWITITCLAEVPEILKQAKYGSVRDRLYPGVHPTDETMNEEWRALITPDLEHLFASAAETFAKDVESLAKPSHPPVALRDLLIARAHCEAWLSALNQARVVLGAQHDVTEADMDQREFDDPSNPKVQALLRIHVLGYLVQLLVEFLSGNGTAGGEAESKS